MTSPILLSRSPHASARWFVLAPHPDDETIGIGALMAEAAATGRLAALAYLTDGSGSHDVGRDGERARLIRWRAREGRLAVHRLCRATPPPIVNLGWRDGNPWQPGSIAFARSVRRLAGLLCRLRIDAIAVTAGNERHCDHVAAHDLAARAVAAARRRIAIFVYRVWGNSMPMPRSPRPPLVTATMPIGRRRHALLAHRSQTSAAFAPGFRVPAALCRMPDRDRLYRDG